MARKRASIPKLQVYNNALNIVYSPLAFEQAILNRKSWDASSSRVSVPIW